MKYYRCLGLLLLVLVTCQSGKNTNEPWISLFNGDNLDGWRFIGNSGEVRVVDSEIWCHMTKESDKHSYVATKEKYSDFILEMDIKTDSTYDSGILLRSFDSPANCDTCHTSLYGYQVKLDSRVERRWTGGIFYDYGKGYHWLYSLEKDNRARFACLPGQWNHFRMEVNGGSIKVWINDIPVTNVLNDDLKEGYIAIKIHWLKQDDADKEKLMGRYKNIRIIANDVEKYTTAMDLPAVEVH